MKSKSTFACTECGYSTSKWLGNCPKCNSWNSFIEEAAMQPVKAKVMKVNKPIRGARSLAEIEITDEVRILTGVAEFDRVMGGGIMQSSITLIAGDPGIGKSTLMTEMGKYLSDKIILYVTGEESGRQVKMRAERLGVNTQNFLLFPETNVEDILNAVQEAQPDIMIVDSIQTIYRPDITSAPGSVSQVRESTAALMALTKSMNMATFVVGHVTKSGEIAGPRILEHMVDTVLHFEGDRHHSYRILRAVKNRFGSTNEIGLFEMRESGLREVENPSEIFLAERRYGQSGSVVVCTLEGTRPLLVEIQALVTASGYGNPQRTPTGFDLRRLQLLLAVLEKREGLKLGTQDVFLNVAGGIKLEEPAVDLGVAVAIASSLQDVPADSGTVLMGEVGLGGEIRTVSRIEQRLNEVQKLGFAKAVVPKSNLKGIKIPEGLEVIGVSKLSEVLQIVL
jgi:DNA repair protein RadA/Sms